MKASRLTSLVLVVAMGALVGCGKDKKSSSGNPHYSYGLYTGPTGQQLPVSTFTELQTAFNNKSLADGLSHNQLVTYRNRTVNTNELFGIDWITYSSASFTCDGYYVSGIPTASTVAVSEKITSDCNNNNFYGSSHWDRNLSSYTRTSNSLMTAFNNLQISAISRITQRAVNYNNASVAAYEVVYNPDPFTSVIYIVSPAVPFMMNPIAVYNSSTGYSRTVEGLANSVY